MADNLTARPDRHEPGDHAEHHEEHPTVATYGWVIMWLMVLLIITLVAAMFDLGEWNLFIAMVIAIVKAGIVMTFFMHLKYSTKLVRFFALGVFFWLLIMFGETMMDFVSRGWLDRGAYPNLSGHSSP